MAAANTIESIYELEVAITETRLQGLKVRKYQTTPSALELFHLWAHRVWLFNRARNLDRLLSALLSKLEGYNYAALEAKDAEEIYGMLAKQVDDSGEMLALLDKAGKMVACASTAKVVARIEGRIDELEDILEGWQLSRDSRFRGMVEASIRELKGEESSAALSR